MYKQINKKEKDLEMRVIYNIWNNGKQMGKNKIKQSRKGCKLIVYSLFIESCKDIRFIEQKYEEVEDQKYYVVLKLGVRNGFKK